VPEEPGGGLRVRAVAEAARQRAEPAAVGDHEGRRCVREAVAGGVRAAHSGAVRAGLPVAAVGAGAGWASRKLEGGQVSSALRTKLPDVKSSQHKTAMCPAPYAKHKRFSIKQLRKP
jgi:hypothetical protein